MLNYELNVIHHLKFNASKHRTLNIKLETLNRTKNFRLYTFNFILK
jgi:hypothetical protein